MRPELRGAIRNDFKTFSCKALEVLGIKHSSERFRDYLMFEVERFVDGDMRRVVVNLPPGHGKTTLFSVLMTAWVLCKDPATKVLLVSYGEDLATKISADIRRILRSEFVTEVFGGLIGDRKQVRNFSTIAGGGVYASWIGGNITGFRADVIVMDDPVEIAADAADIEEAINFYKSTIKSRLDDPRRGRTILIAHRIAEEDPSAYLLRKGFEHVVLPLVATEDREYKTATGIWVRKRGELLRPNMYDEAELQELREENVEPDFELLYQQGISGTQASLERKHFGLFESRYLPKRMPTVLSIDTAAKEGEGRSFSVIMVISPMEGGGHAVRDVWREQASYNSLRRNALILKRRYEPGVILVEDNSMGSMLLQEKKLRRNTEVVPIVPTRSKSARLQRQMHAMMQGRIKLMRGAQWRTDLLEEILAGPKRKHNDQLDALLQYLDFMESDPNIPLAPERGEGFAIISGSEPARVLNLTEGSRGLGAIAGGRRRYW